MKPIRFGKYSLLDRISHGGMAEVFRAKTFGAAGFERTVAIKLLLPTVAMDREFITMLIDEAKIAGQLSHANIAQIFDLGMAEGRYYIVQEYVNGKDLRAILRALTSQGQRLSIAQSTHVMLKVCEGLEYAHNKRDAAGRALNLVHRDVSPQNVVVSREGEVKLIDFGIAKAEGRATRTLAGLVKGKFAYMSPEQIRGLPVDRRSDVFACGIVMWELLTGKPLFRRKSEFETLKRARSAEIEAPSTINADVPPELDAVVLKALARHVEDRYQTAIALRDDIWEFVRAAGEFYSRNELAGWMRDSFGKGDDVVGTAAAPVDHGLSSEEYSLDIASSPGTEIPTPSDLITPQQDLGPNQQDEFDAATMIDPELAARLQSGNLSPEELVAALPVAQLPDVADRSQMEVDDLDEEERRPTLAYDSPNVALITNGPPQETHINQVDSLPASFGGAPQPPLQDQPQYPATGPGPAGAYPQAAPYVARGGELANPIERAQLSGVLPPPRAPAPNGGPPAGIHGSGQYSADALNAGPGPTPHAPMGRTPHPTGPPAPGPQHPGFGMGPGPGPAPGPNGFAPPMAAGPMPGPQGHMPVPGAPYGSPPPGHIPGPPQGPHIAGGAPAGKPRVSQQYLSTQKLPRLDQKQKSKWHSRFIGAAILVLLIAGAASITLAITG